MIEIDGEFFSDPYEILNASICIDKIIACSGIFITAVECSAKQPILKDVFMKTANIQARIIFSQPNIPKNETGGIVFHPPIGSVNE